MAVSFVWPPTLPQAVRKDFAEDNGALILPTPMDAGPAKLRRRGNRPSQMTLGFYMTTAQVEILETFVLNTLRGTARFGFPHPRTGLQVEARIVPGDEGKLYDVKYSTPGEWLVDMTIEVLP